jgi:hypothetical protein
VVVLAANFKSLVQGIYLSADVVSAPYIGELYGQAPPDANVVLGNFPWYTTLWFEQLTHGLPAHRQIWQVGPWLASLAGVGVVAWSTWRAAGRWAGTMVAVALGCAGPALLVYQFGASLHAVTFVHVCLLGGFLVLCAARPRGMVGGPAWHAALCLLLAGVTAAGLASDRLLMVAGVIPFVLAGLAAGWVIAAPAGRRIAVSSALVGVAAVIGSRVIVSVMEGQDVRPYTFDVAMAGFDRITTNFRLLAQSLAYLFNGDFSGLRLSAETALTVACAGALTVAVVAAFRYGLRWWRGELRVPRPAPSPAGGEESMRALHIAFWALAGSLLALAFVLTDVAQNRYSARYLLTAGYAVAALVPVAAVLRGRGARAIVTVGVCVIAGGSIMGLARRDVQANPSHYPTGTVAGPLLRLAQTERVNYGYAGYWDAAALTWQMKMKLRLYPISECGTNRLCPFPFHKISSWYTPRPGTRSLYVVDHLQQSRPDPKEPGDRFGRPDRAVSIGQLTVYVYPYDIASRFL